MIAFRKQARAALIVAALLAVAVIGAYVAGQLLPQPVKLNITTEQAESLAALNGKTLDDFGRGYLVRNNYFADLEYAEVKDEPLPLTLTIGNRNEPLKGVRVDGQPVAIEVMACDWQERACGFRINGVATGAMKPGQGAASEFLLDLDYKLVLVNVQIDYCEGRRFCNTHFEAYDVIDTVVVRQ